MRKTKTIKIFTGKFFENLPQRFFLFGFIFLSLAFLISCSEIAPPKTTPFVGKTAPPKINEFRWSNGKMPKSFDPAMATSAPETDVVRAIFEGLTEIDAKTLETIPAIAVKFTPSDDFKTWTFELRQDAKWTNGETVTAHHFVKSWKRLTELGEKVARRSLLKNIVGMNTEDVVPVFAEESFSEDENAETAANKANSNLQANANLSDNSNKIYQKNQNSTAKESSAIEKTPLRKQLETASKFGVEAIGDFTLKVILIEPDEDFPALVAHPIFRPIYGDGSEFEKLGTNIITNGAFQLDSVENGVLIKPSENFYDRKNIKIESVRFVPVENADAALAAYRSGEVEAVTNAALQPLTRKLLLPYEKEFRQVKHGAINLYEFNVNNKPFDDRRIREALTIAIKRENITEIELEGSTKAAYSFLPFENEKKFTEDIGKAKKLFAEAGFENGVNFPKVKLLINRNDVQRRVARMVVKMWRENLNIETEIIVKDQDDYTNALKNGEYDIVRRGVVLPTTDETANMMTIFDPLRRQISFDVDDETKTDEPLTIPQNSPENLNTNSEVLDKKIKNVKKILQLPEITSEKEAFEIYPAIPLYFSLSYALVKPYIKNFENNALDSPLLKNVEIDKNWKEKSAE